MTNGNNFFVNRKQNLTLMPSLIRFGIFYPLNLSSEQTLNWEPKILQITAFYQLWIVLELKMWIN